MGSVFSKWFFLLKRGKSTFVDVLYLFGRFLSIYFSDKCLSLFSLLLLLPILLLSHSHFHFPSISPALSVPEFAFFIRRLPIISLLLQDPSKKLPPFLFLCFIRRERKCSVEERRRRRQNKTNLSHIRWKINFLLSRIASPVLLLGVIPLLS